MMIYEQIRTDSGMFAVPVPNTVMNGDGFYVSYNDHDTHIYGSDTTALVFGQMERFFILVGDHRTQYAELIPAGFGACLEYFKANPDLAHRHSDGVDNIPGFEPQLPSTFRP